MRMSVENGIVAFIVLVLELVIEGLEDEDRFAEDEDDYDIAAFTNNSIFSASRTLIVLFEKMNLALWIERAVCIYLPIV